LHRTLRETALDLLTTRERVSAISDKGTTNLGADNHGTMASWELYAFAGLMLTMYPDRARRVADHVAVERAFAKAKIRHRSGGRINQ
jgi:hypothetical protein